MMFLVRDVHLVSFLCCVCALLVFILCHVYPMLPVSLDYLFMNALSVFSDVYIAKLENYTPSKNVRLSLPSLNVEIC